MRDAANRLLRVSSLAAVVCCGGALGACDSQTAPSCAYTVTPTGAPAPAAGAPLTVVVATGSKCTWTAASNAPWLVLFAGPSSLAGGATLQVGVMPNRDPAPRTGTLTIAGQTVTVTQAGQQLLSLSGTVREPMTGVALDGVNVVIVSGPTIKSTLTAADGTYSLDGLLPGQYSIRFAKAFFGPDVLIPISVPQNTTFAWTMNPQGRLPYTTQDVGAYWDGGGPYPNEPFRVAIYQDGTSVRGFYRARSDVSGGVTGTYQGGRLTLRVPLDGAVLTFDLTLDDARNARGLVKDERFGGNFPVQMKR